MGRLCRVSFCLQVHSASHHTTLLTLHNRLPCLCVPLLRNCTMLQTQLFFSITKGCSCFSEYLPSNIIIRYPPRLGVKPQFPWFISPSLTYDGAKLCLILRHGNPRNPPACTRGSPNALRTNTRTSGSGFLPQQVG